MLNGNSVARYACVQCGFGVENGVLVLVAVQRCRAIGACSGGVRGM